MLAVIPLNAYKGSCSPLLLQALPASSFIMLIYQNFYRVRKMHTRRRKVDELLLIKAYEVTKSLPSASETVDIHVLVRKAHNISMFSCSSACSLRASRAAPKIQFVYPQIFLQNACYSNFIVFYIYIFARYFVQVLTIYCPLDHCFSKWVSQNFRVPQKTVWGSEKNSVIKE